MIIGDPAPAQAAGPPVGVCPRSLPLRGPLPTLCPHMRSRRQRLRVHGRCCAYRGQAEPPGDSCSSACFASFFFFFFSSGKWQEAVVWRAPQRVHTPRCCCGAPSPPLQPRHGGFLPPFFFFFFLAAFKGRKLSYGGPRSEYSLSAVVAAPPPPLCQVASRLVSAFTTYKQYDLERQVRTACMRTATD
jgi:hypothetical protein